MHTIEKLSIEELQEVSQVLWAPPFCMHAGICGNYIDRFNGLTSVAVRHLMIQCCTELGVYSGTPAFPIKHEWVGAEEAYYRENLWKLKSDYCLSRVSVLELMREKVEGVLKELVG